MDTSLGWFQSRFGGGGEEERKPLPLPEVKPGRPVRNLVAILIAPFRLPKFPSIFINVIQTYKQVLRVGQT
jgi:hypothetical protein